MVFLGSGGGIRTRDLWVMSPTSCHCSTPRYRGDAGTNLRSAGVCARRPRLPRSRPRSTLRRWRRARPGSGWIGVVRRRSRPRAHPSFPRCDSLGSTISCLDTTRLRPSLLCGPVLAEPSLPHAAHARRRGLPTTRDNGGHTPPSTMSTASLRSVTRRPRAASQPGGLPGVLPLSSEKVHLGAGFPLRCCQRLSLPNVATQQCRFSDNWHTRGSSSPVLSY